MYNLHMRSSPSHHKSDKSLLPPSLKDMQPAIFIDRDGVIIENRADYVRSWADVEIYPQSLLALALVSSSPFKISLTTASEINNRLLQIIRENGGRIDGIYMCPHQDEDQCECRKPKPGLLIRARDELSIDLSRSIMIGDALSDLRAGRSAGVQKNFLVLTGRGKEQVQLTEAASLQPILVYPDLKEALSALISWK
jgi:D-glycero-D-manno-heptose 1,7-bisphosphate phosphatase